MNSKILFLFSQRAFCNFLLLSIAILLASCGGGTDNSPGAASQPSASLSTTQQNQSVIPGPVMAASQLAMSSAEVRSVAANAFAVSDYLFDPARYADQFLTGVKPNGFPLAASTLAWYFGEINWDALKAVGMPTVPINFTCSHGGSVITTGTVSSVILNIRDTLRMDAKNCTTADDITFNGELTLIVVPRPDPVPGKAWADTNYLRFKHFSIVSATGAVEYDGDLEFDLNITALGSISSITSGAEMHVIGHRNGQTPVDVTIRQYKTSNSFAPGEVRSQMEFTRQSTGSSGQAITVAVKTPQTFVRTSGQYSSTGVLSVSDGVSTATVTALDGTSARIDYSPASEGIVTESNTLGWSDFLSAK